MLAKKCRHGGPHPSEITGVIGIITALLAEVTNGQKGEDHMAHCRRLVAFWNTPGFKRILVQHRAFQQTLNVSVTSVGVRRVTHPLHCSAL
jgi:hypothetical protein